TIHEISPGASRGAREEGDQVCTHFTDYLADQIDSVHRALQAAVRELEHRDQWLLSRLFSQGARALGKSSERVRTKKTRALISDLGEYANEHPFAFFGGAVAAGLIVARLFENRPRSDVSEHRLW